MGHDLSLDNNYFKPSSDDLLDSYIQVVNLLTLNEEFRLRQRVQKLEIEKNTYDDLAAEIAQIKRSMKKNQ